MAHVEVHEELDLADPLLVEGLPGVGLVGKIAADHLISEFDMDHVATPRCEGIPDVATYAEGERPVRGPVRIYVDRERELLALQSDVPVSADRSTGFATCVTSWLAEHDATPIYLSGLAGEKDGVPEMYGIATGDGGGLLEDHDIGAPNEAGMISGPTGALLAEAQTQGLDGVGLIVEANPQFPDPEAARVLLADGVAPIAGIEIETEALVEQAEEIAEARDRLAQRMQQADSESTEAQPLGMYQ